MRLTKFVSICHKNLNKTQIQEEKTKTTLQINNWYMCMSNNTMLD